MDRQMNIALRKTLDQIGVKHSLKGYGFSGKRKTDKFRVYRINNRFCFLVW